MIDKLILERLCVTEVINEEDTTMVTHHNIYPSWVSSRSGGRRFNVIPFADND